MKVALDARHAGRGLGIANFVCELARELIAAGDVGLIWLGDPALAPDGVLRSVAVHRLPYPAIDGLFGRRLALHVGAEVIHFTGNTGWGRPGPIASVLSVQDLIFLSPSPAGRRSVRQVVGHAYERRLIPRAAHAADVLAVSSETIADQVRTRLGPTLAPRVIPYGVRCPAAAERSLTADAYLLAFAGRDPRKRTADVVAAWRSLGEGRAGPRLTLRLRLLASGGLPPGLCESLEPDVARGSVTILEHVSRERVWEELAGATALVYPSSEEGFGLPVLEGMAAGTPVLSGLAPATREVGGNAIVQLDPEDVPGSIAAAVRQLQDDPPGTRAVVQRGRERAAAFTWRRTAEGYHALYEEAIARHSGRAGR